jgi:hypothetical protein
MNSWPMAILEPPIPGFDISLNMQLSIAQDWAAWLAFWRTI